MWFKLNALWECTVVCFLQIRKWNCYPPYLLSCIEGELFHIFCANLPAFAVCLWLLDLDQMIRLNSISGTSSSQDRTEDAEEDAWTIWGRVVSDWDNFFKKKNQYVRVSGFNSKCFLALCKSVAVFWKFVKFIMFGRILSERVSRTNCAALSGKDYAVRKSHLLPNSMQSISKLHQLVKRFANSITLF